MLDSELIGQRIKDRRKELGITLQEIAEDIKVNKSTIQRYESGKIKDIKNPIINSIASCLSVNPLWLLGEAEHKTHSPDYEQSTHLMNMYFRSIVNWTDDSSFNENESTIIREHFYDLLLRYKNIVEAYSNANRSWKVSGESFKKLYEDKYTDLEIKEKFLKSELERSLSDATDWINAFPNWIARNEDRVK